MTDPAGTTESKPDGGNAGTQAGGTGGGNGGRTPTPEDLKALATAHEQNLVKERERTRQLESQIQELRNQVLATAPAPLADPRTQMFQGLQERAAYDPNAQAILVVSEAAEIARLDNQVLTAILVAGVPQQFVPTVQQLIKDSGYRMPVADALRLARGTTVDKVEAENQELRKQLDQRNKELEAEKSRVKVNTATYPAAPPPEATTISGSDYNAILSRGGPDARALMERVNSPKGSPGHVDLDLHQ